MIVYWNCIVNKKNFRRNYRTKLITAKADYYKMEYNEYRNANNKNIENESKGIVSTNIIVHKHNEI